MADSNKKLVVYIAGPFRAHTLWQVVQNVRDAEAAALSVWREGLVALCPHTMTFNFSGAASDDVWLDGTMELMRRCDAVYVQGEWGKSEGTKLEIAEALRLGIPVFYDFGHLLQWADGVTVADSDDITDKLYEAYNDALAAVANEGGWDA